MSDIEGLRNKMDQVTLELLKLLKDRTEIAKQIGEIKKNTGKSITDETREDNLRSKVIALSTEIGLDENLAAKFLNFLLNESIKVQSENDRQTHLSIFLKAKTMEQKGKKIIHMEVGEPDFMPPDIVKSALQESFDKGFIRYGQAKGHTQLREALAKKIATQYDNNSNTEQAITTQENILVTPGARFSIFLAITTLLNPGDEIIVIEPAWPAYKDCALNAGVKVRSIKTTMDSKWEPSIQEISKTINSNTKMIILNYPNNPTGKVLPVPLQNKIIDIAKQNKLYILSDEIYGQYTNNTQWKSVLEYKYDKAIIAQSFSKSHAMTGFRIGYTVAQKAIVEKMAKLQALCLTSVSEPIQYTAIKALDVDTTNNTRIINTRLDMLTKKAEQIAGLDFVSPDGAMYLFARINKKGFDGVEFANKMLQDHGLAIAPGQGFGDYKEFIRISACQDEDTLREGLNILSKVLMN